MKEKLIEQTKYVFRRPMGYVSIGLILFPLFIQTGGESLMMGVLREWPVYGVFIIPGCIGLMMLFLTRDEVSKIHGRFDGIDTKLDRIDTKLDRIDTKLDRIDTKLDKLDDITIILREIAGYLKKGN